VRARQPKAREKKISLLNELLEENRKKKSAMLGLKGELAAQRGKKRE